MCHVYNFCCCCFGTAVTGDGHDGAQHARAYGRPIVRLGAPPEAHGHHPGAGPRALRPGESPFLHAEAVHSSCGFHTSVRKSASRKSNVVLVAGDRLYLVVVLRLVTRAHHLCLSTLSFVLVLRLGHHCAYLPHPLSLSFALVLMVIIVVIYLVGSLFVVLVFVRRLIALAHHWACLPHPFPYLCPSSYC